MYPVVQRAQTQGQGRSEEHRFGHQGTVWEYDLDTRWPQVFECQEYHRGH
ncbi:hypothetical protein ACE6H2_027073 [Prunus campanulata]